MAARRSAGCLRRLREQLAGLLGEGLQPRQLALALALGATIGLMPTVWGTSLICLLAAALLRVNQLAVQLANYLVYPLQILLFIPYFKLGARLFSLHALPNNLDLLLDHLQTAPLEVLGLCWQANLQAICSWLLTVPALLAGGYLLSLTLVAPTRVSRKAHDL